MDTGSNLITLAIGLVNPFAHINFRNKMGKTVMVLKAAGYAYFANSARKKRKKNLSNALWAASGITVAYNIHANSKEV